MAYHGKQDLNAILRGETPVQTGDTFIHESTYGEGFAAFRYTPQTPEPPKPCEHFKLLARGIWETCLKACHV